MHPVKGRGPRSLLARPRPIRVRRAGSHREAARQCCTQVPAGTRGRWRHATCSSEAAGNPHGCRAETLPQAPLRRHTQKPQGSLPANSNAEHEAKRDSAQAPQASALGLIKHGRARTKPRQRCPKGLRYCAAQVSLPQASRSSRSGENCHSCGDVAVSGQEGRVLDAVRRGLWL